LQARKKTVTIQNSENIFSFYYGSGAMDCVEKEKIKENRTKRVFLQQINKLSKMLFKFLKLAQT